jgi:hypothetical protein
MCLVKGSPCFSGSLSTAVCASSVVKPGINRVGIVLDFFLSCGSCYVANVSLVMVTTHQVLALV